MGFFGLSDDERGRMREVGRRLIPVGWRAAALVAIASLVAVPTFGPAPAITTVLAAVVIAAASATASRFRRPEILLSAAWAASFLVIVVGIGLATGPRLLLLPIVVVTTVRASVTFPARMVVWTTALSVLGMLVVSLGLNTPAVLAEPPILIIPLAVVLTSAILAARIRDLDAESRSTAVVDRLTGTLNRAALMPRLAELEHQSRSTGEPVAIVVGDIDHFKSVNDEHGHAVGDAVLRGVVDRLRMALGAFESVYRLGGEEFVIVFVGAQVRRAGETAERMRHAVGEAPVGGVPITISFGVAVSPPGEFAFEPVFEQADAALYEAKHAGRDRVRLAVAPETITSADKRVRLSRAGDREPASTLDGSGPPIAAGSPIAPTSTSRPRHLIDEQPANRGWLVSDQVERDHLLDLGSRVRGVQIAIYLLTFAAFLACTPWFGWLILVPLIIAAVTTFMLGVLIERFPRPEQAFVLACSINLLGCVTAFVLISGPSPPVSVTVLLALPLIAFCACFPARGVVCGVVATAASIVGVSLAINAAQVLSAPASLAYVLVTMAALAMIGRALGASATGHRGAAVIDGLTGMFNRLALEARTAELAHQANAGGGQVAVILADVDHFKRVNDKHGHGVGDAVLREVAYRLRSQLRAFESAYRIGGEEFVILLVGTDAAAAAVVAERLRNTIRGAPVAGVAVTMSFGAAASAPGEAFDYAEVFARTDAVLYDAKHAGRDCVRVDRTDAAAPPLFAAAA